MVRTYLLANSRLQAKTRVGKKSVVKNCIREIEALKAASRRAFEESTAAGVSGSGVLYNRQLHPEEVTLAKQIADKSGGKYTQAQVKDQLRIMGVSVNGASESSAPTTLIGQTPTDSGAQWISGGTTTDGKPILTQISCKRFNR